MASYGLLRWRSGLWVAAFEWSGDLTHLDSHAATRATHDCLKTCRTYQWPKREILLSKSPNFNQSILSYLNWLPCSKSFHHILVRITNSCIFLHFRYVCNCDCSTNPRLFLQNISRNILKTAKWLPSRECDPNTALSDCLTAHLRTQKFRPRPSC